MKIEKVPFDRLKQNPLNSKLHTEEQIRHIQESLLKFGWTQPIVVDEDYMILVGHGRYAAARNMAANGDMRWVEMPCVVRSGLTEQEKQALCVADNKIQQETSLNEAVVDELTAAMDVAGIPVGVFGLEVKEVSADTMAVENQVDDDQGSIKQLGIVFKNEDFERVVNEFDAISKANPELENNTLVFLALLKKYEEKVDASLSR